MNFKEALSKLKRSKEFKSWHKSNPKAYLAHGFLMSEHTAAREWQIGYYVPGHDKMVSFFIGEEIKKSPESEIFKKDEKKVKELDASKVKISFEQIVQIVEEFQKKEYPGELVGKIFVIVQNLPIGQVWNVTALTKTFKTLNIKLDSSTGEVKEHKLTSLMDFKAN